MRLSKLERRIEQVENQVEQEQKDNRALKIELAKSKTQSSKNSEYQSDIMSDFKGN